MDTTRNVGAGRRPSHLGRWVAALMLLAAPGVGLAGSGVDLNVTVTVSPAASGVANVKFTIKNLGTNPAGGWSLLALVDSPTFSGAGLTGPASCAFVPVPPAHNSAFRCNSVGSLAAGGTAVLSGTLSGAATSDVAVEAQVAPATATLDDVPRNNVARATTVYGPATDLVIYSNSKPGPLAGHATVVVTVVNAGGRAANGVSFTGQVVTSHFSAVGASSSVGTVGCVFVAPATGYNVAYKCTDSSALPSHASFTITLDFAGDGTAAGTALRQDASVANTSPMDREPANDDTTTTTTFQ